jgi:hypothetical protein
VSSGAVSDKCRWGAMRVVVSLAGAALALVAVAGASPRGLGESGLAGLTVMLSVLLAVAGEEDGWGIVGRRPGRESAHPQRAPDCLGFARKPQAANKRSRGEPANDDRQNHYTEGRGHHELSARKLGG